MSDVSRILTAIEHGDPQAAEQLLPLVYDELRKLAAAKLSNENPGQTLQATALVHEAYLRLIDVEQAQNWEGRRHFFCAAAEAMRRILIERARRYGRIKHGGGQKQVELFDIPAFKEFPLDDLVALDEALRKLAIEDPDKARLVELRYFTGLTNEQAAEVLGVSVVTIKRHWRFARAWLRREMKGFDTSAEK